MKDLPSKKKKKTNEDKDEDYRISIDEE